MFKNGVNKLIVLVFFGVWSHRGPRMVPRVVPERPLGSKSWVQGSECRPLEVKITADIASRRVQKGIQIPSRWLPAVVTREIAAAKS